MEELLSYPKICRKNIRRIESAVGASPETAYAMMLMTALLMDLHPEDEQQKTKEIGLAKLTFGKKADPFISLKPDISKLKEHTSWEPEIGFSEGVLRFADEKN